MKIGILGTRGIPNHHGGFEQFAEFFSVFLVNKGHEVYVYNSSSHPYKKKSFQGVNIIHANDPEDKLGTFGQFIYDFNCIWDSRKRGFDILLQLGYTSNSIWYNLLPENSLIITNMDGLEWKRTKYSKPVQKFLKLAEKLAVMSSDYLVADSIGIKNYLMKAYSVDSTYIAYGAELFDKPNAGTLKKYQLEPLTYNLLIARLEPENNVETILDGIVASKENNPFLVIGKYDVNEFGRYLKRKYQTHTNIKFLGGIYNLETLNNLRYYSNLYFHGHSVGGTNPSLLEAMASKALIVAHDNEFNKSILGENAYYFKTAEHVEKHVRTIHKNEQKDKVENCYKIISNNYSWQFINQQYLDFFYECLD